MKPSPDNQLFFALQQTVTTALKQWLDENKTEIFRVMRDAVLQGENAKQEQRRQQVKEGEFLTVTELAKRFSDCGLDDLFHGSTLLCSKSSSKPQKWA